MKVTVMRSNPEAWYAKRIGETFEVENFTLDFYSEEAWVIKGSRILVILCEHAEIVED